MNIILISNRTGQTHRLNLPLHRWWAWAGIVSVTLALFVGVFSLGYNAAPDVAEVVYSAKVTQGWEQELAAQRGDIDKTRRQFDAEVNALAHRLAKLQAHVARLNAVGHRMTEVASIDPEEFDFSLDPAVGGVESEVAGEQSLDEYKAALKDFSDNLSRRERQLRVLQDLMVASRLRDQIYPSGKPVRTGWISSGFGMRGDPFNGRRSMHKGLDFVARTGADVLAVGGGVVITSERHAGYGNMVEINHGNGYMTRYAHHSKNLVKVGDRIEKGQRIALVGSTGRSTGPHLHFEVYRNGKLVNPAKFVRAAN